MKGNTFLLVMLLAILCLALSPLDAAKSKKPKVVPTSTPILTPVQTPTPVPDVKPSFTPVQEPSPRSYDPFRIGVYGGYTTVRMNRVNNMIGDQHDADIYMFDGIAGVVTNAETGYGAVLDADYGLFKEFRIGVRYEYYQNIIARYRLVNALNDYTLTIDSSWTGLMGGGSYEFQFIPAIPWHVDLSAYGGWAWSKPKMNITNVGLARQVNMEGSAFLWELGTGTGYQVLKGVPSFTLGVRVDYRFLRFSQMTIYSMETSSNFPDFFKRYVPGQPFRDMVYPYHDIIDFDLSGLAVSAGLTVGF